MVGVCLRLIWFFLSSQNDCRMKQVRGTNIIVLHVLKCPVAFTLSCSYIAPDSHCTVLHLMLYMLFKDLVSSISPEPCCLPCIFAHTICIAFYFPSNYGTWQPAADRAHWSSAQAGQAPCFSGEKEKSEYCDPCSFCMHGYQLYAHRPRLGGTKCLHLNCNGQKWLIVLNYFGSHEVWK